MIQPLTLTLSGNPGSLQAERLDARQFVARFVADGQACGPLGNLVHVQPGPVVEVFDATHAGKKGFHPLGQLVASYRAEDVAKFPRDTGLDLSGGNPQWRLPSHSAMALTRWCSALIDAMPSSDQVSGPASMTAEPETPTARSLGCRP